MYKNISEKRAMQERQFARKLAEFKKRGGKIRQCKQGESGLVYLNTWRAAQLGLKAGQYTRAFIESRIQRAEGIRADLMHDALHPTVKDSALADSFALMNCGELLKRAR